MRSTIQRQESRQSVGKKENENNLSANRMYCYGKCTKENIKNKIINEGCGY